MMFSSQSLVSPSLVICSLIATTLWADEKTELMEIGKQQFTSCVACHGPDGNGVKIDGGLVMAPTLRDSVYLKSESPEALAVLVMKGIKKESDTYIQQMLGLESTFDDKMLAGVLTYTRNTFGGHDNMVSPKDVKGWRASYKKIPPLTNRATLDAISLASQIDGLGDLTYASYEINVKKLPDFRTLEPKAEGDVPKGLITLDVVDKDLIKRSFGLVFEGTLMIPKTAKYDFLLHSDDGSRLYIDGEAELNNDGIHSGKTIETKPIKLEEGVHTVRIEFFQGGGSKELGFAIRPSGTKIIIPLSTRKLGSAGGGKKAVDPIPLVARADNEAVLYRNFIRNARPRGIAVGYPGEVNLCWDADEMNLSSIWRGSFMDASRHWTGRGQGAQPPFGVDVAQPADGLPLHVFASPEAKVSFEHQEKIAYERDNDNPQAEISYTMPPPEYRFRGYRLDANRFPTFSYEYRGLKITDRFDPIDAQGTGFSRKLTFTGSPDAQTHYLIARGGSLADGTVTNQGVDVSVTGGTIIQRDGAYFVPITQANQELTIEYRWQLPKQ